MPNRIRNLYRTVLNCGVLTGVLFPAALTMGQESDNGAAAKSTASTSKLQTPMTDSGPIAAPYSDRLRITGYLARQHAREGNSWRALTEFYSMLNVDDPAWTDDESGDAMRIARDIDVAQLMTEVGLFEHAVRVLHTSLILACVDHDPQVFQVESQLIATTELAHVKGAIVPEIDMSFLYDDDWVRPATLANLTRSQPAVPSAGPSLPVPQSVPESASVPQERQAVPPNELPKKKAATTVQSNPVAQRTNSPVIQDNTLDDRSRKAWWSPSRWRQKKDIAPAVSVQEDTVADRRVTSPNVAPTYCQECNGLHGTPGNVVVRYNPRTGITHSHVPGQSAPSEMPSPYQKHFSPLQSDGSGTTGDIAPSTSSRPPRSSTADETAVATTTSSATTRSSTAQTPATPGELSPKLYQSRTQAAEKTAPAETVQAKTEATDGPALSGLPNPPSTTSSNDDAHSRTVPVSSRSQVGIAGDVSNPGIFSLQSRSTTLAALLRRTGDSGVAADKKARILRAVDCRDEGATEPRKDYYCQRLDGSLSNAAALNTPVYSQEIVIIDGTGDKPVYVAVMPHFILQVPIEKNSSVTSEQILDRLALHWPEVRSQSVGVLRYEDWGSTAAASRGDAASEYSKRPLTGGDVFYVDGTNLDPAQVIPAAESIAKMAGARLRKLDAASQ